MCVAYYSVDILNHFVLQCLSSLPLNISKDSEATVFSLSEFQSSMILWLSACFLSSDSKYGLNSFMLWLLVPLYIACIKNFLGSILSIFCKILKTSVQILVKYSGLPDHNNNVECSASGWILLPRVNNGHFLSIPIGIFHSLESKCSGPEWQFWVFLPLPVVRAEVLI